MHALEIWVPLPCSRGMPSLSCICVYPCRKVLGVGVGVVVVTTTTTTTTSTKATTTTTTTTTKTKTGSSPYQPRAVLQQLREHKLYGLPRRRA